MNHDVKIVVMKPSEVESMKEPLCPEPDVRLSSNNRALPHLRVMNKQVHIILPPLQKLRTVTERLKSLSDVVGISANKSGNLKLSIQTQRIKADTIWSNLENPTISDGLSLSSSSSSSCH